MVNYHSKSLFLLLGHSFPEFKESDAMFAAEKVSLNVWFVPLKH